MGLDLEPAAPLYVRSGRPIPSARKMPLRLRYEKDFMEWGEKGMGKQDNELIETFRQDKLMPDETLEADIKGWLDKKTGQGVIQHDGQFVLTNKRACFYSEAPFEEIFETIPLSKITSVETSSLMGYRVLRVHTAHDDLEFKTLEPKDLFDNVVANLERLRNEPTGDFVAPTV